MRLLVKSSQRVVEMNSSVFNKLSNDQKRSYQILDHKDAPVQSEQIVTNEAGNDSKKKK